MIRASIILLTLLIGVSCLNAQVAIPPSAGNGTENNPYHISSLGNLYWIAESSTRWELCYIQTADIDAYETVNWFQGRGWLPIGVYSEFPEPDYQPFRGRYDGMGYEIVGLYINRPATDQIGLFGSIEGAIIKDLSLIDIEVTGYNDIGALVGISNNNSSIRNCNSSGIVNGNNSVGGLVGSNAYDSEVNYSYSTGMVNGNYRVGGLVGFNSWNSYINNSYSLAIVTGNNRFGGLVGAVNLANLTNSYYDYEESLINGAHHLTIGAISSDMFNSWLNNDLYLEIDDYLLSDGENYLINSNEEFQALLAFGQFPDLSFMLIDNLDFSNMAGFYVPYFTGHFQGNGKLIDNIHLDLNDRSDLGLFGYVVGAIIEGLSITNIEISGNEQVGGLIGININSEVRDCQVSGSITGYRDVGGLVGLNTHDSLIDGCQSSGSVQGDHVYIGGLIGRNTGYSSVKNSFSSSNVTGKHNNVGGLVGINIWSSTIIGCYSTGQVIGSYNYTGGLAGGNSQTSTISNSFSTGDVTGIVSVGGLCGINHYSSIYNSYCTGSVNGDTSIGGLAGTMTNATLMNSYSMSPVTGVEKVGGLVGQYINSSEIINSYCTGLVLGQNDVGGLAGYSYWQTEIVRSYWDMETSGQTESAGGSGRTTEQMTYPHDSSTYLNWNFQQIWDLDTDHTINDGYPFIREDALSADEFFITPDIPLSLYNYPNPFNPETIIEFSLPQRGDVKLTIYNIKGQQIRILVNEKKEKGENRIIWDGRDDRGRIMASGIYFCQLVASDRTISRKMILLK